MKFLLNNFSFRAYIVIKEIEGIGKENSFEIVVFQKQLQLFPTDFIYIFPFPEIEKAKICPQYLKVSPTFFKLSIKKHSQKYYEMIKTELPEVEEQPML